MMKLPILVALSLVTLVFTGPQASANYLDNADFKKGIVGWHGDGTIAFLKADGTEGAEFDDGVIPVMKIALARTRPRSVYQEFDTKTKPGMMNMKVSVFASADFARSKYENDYNIKWSAGGTWYWSEIAIPPVDFWIRGGPGWFYKLANLKPGKWVEVKGHFEGLSESDSHGINFCVPPGQGTVYLRDPVAN